MGTKLGGISRKEHGAGPAHGETLFSRSRRAVTSFMLLARVGGSVADSALLFVEEGGFQPDVSSTNSFAPFWSAAFLDLSTGFSTLKGYMQITERGTAKRDPTSGILPWEDVAAR